MTPPDPHTYSSFVRKLFNRSGDPSKDMAHAILGVVTEIHEYLQATDDVNAIEELGDLTFYVEAAAQVAEDYRKGTVDVDQAEGPALARLTEALAASFPAGELRELCNELLDIAKRWVGYGKAPASLQAVMVKIAVASALAANLGRLDPDKFDGDHIEAVNMAKLLNRYPGGEFDQYRAYVRNLEVERAALEAAHLG